MPSPISIIRQPPYEHRSQDISQAGIFERDREKGFPLTLYPPAIEQGHPDGAGAKTVGRSKVDAVMASRPLAGVHVEAVAAGAIIHLAKGILVIREAGKVFIAPGGLIADIIANGEFHCFHSLVPKGKEHQLFLPLSVSSNGTAVKTMSHIDRQG